MPRQSRQRSRIAVKAMDTQRDESTFIVLLSNNADLVIMDEKKTSRRGCLFDGPLEPADVRPWTALAKCRARASSSVPSAEGNVVGLSFYPIRKE